MFFLLQRLEMKFWECRSWGPQKKVIIYNGTAWGSVYHMAFLLVLIITCNCRWLGGEMFLFFSLRPGHGDRFTHVTHCFKQLKKCLEGHLTLMVDFLHWLCILFTLIFIILILLPHIVVSIRIPLSMTKLTYKFHIDCYMCEQNSSNMSKLTICFFVKH
jgi:hypothetical protein